MRSPIDPMDTIDPDTLLRAYAIGAFPMAENATSQTLYWVDPEWRGVLPLDTFHVPRRLVRTIKSGRFEVRINTCFRTVMEACAEDTGGRGSTWINASILDAYCELHARGASHCVECWRDGKLVGGLYGVSLGRAFFGESMFARERDASKVALVHLVARLLRGGYVLLDTQFVTGHLEQFGAIEIPRDAYKTRLAEALTGDPGDFYPASDGTAEMDGSAILQSINQTS